MKLIAIFGSALGVGVVSLSVAMGAPATNAVPESLAALARKVRTDFLLGSFASGLDFTRPGNPPLADFFRRNFNIMTVGIYMTGTQRERDAYNCEKTDVLIQFAEQNHLQVYLHPMIGGAEYTPKWVNEGGLSAEALQQVMRDRITTILTRYQGRIHYVDVVNESLTGQGRKADGQFEWQAKAYRGGDHVWFKTLGMYQGKKHQFPRYLVEAFRIARNVGGPGAAHGHVEARLVQTGRYDLRGVRWLAEGASPATHCRENETGELERTSHLNLAPSRE